MTKRLLLRWSIALLIAITTWATHGTAAQTAAELNALSCCAHDCGHDPARAADPSRCCGVAPSAGEAVSAPAAPSPAPALVTVLAAAPAASDAPAALAETAVDLTGARAAPVFLLTRSLRI